MKKHIHIALLVSTLTFSVFSFAQAASVEGVIKGAQCYLQKGECSQSRNDPHLVLENDFVLVTSDKYYFLHNLPREEKLRVYNEMVRIEGDIANKSIEVERLFQEHGDSENILWDGPEIFSELYEG